MYEREGESICRYGVVVEWLSGSGCERERGGKVLSQTQSFFPKVA